MLDVRWYFARLYVLRESDLGAIICKSFKEIDIAPGLGNSAQHV